MQAYKILADTQAKKVDLDEGQVQQMKKSWIVKLAGETKKQEQKDAEDEEGHAKEHVEEAQQAGE